MAKVTRIEGLQEAIAVIDDEIARKASVRSINVVTAQGRTEANRIIRETYNVKVAPLNAALKVTKISQTGGGTAKITAKGSTPGAQGRNMTNRFLLTDFTGTRVLKSGVSFQIKKAGPRGKLNWAFGAQMASGHIGIFERVWRAEHPSLVHLGTSTTKTPWKRLPKKLRLKIWQVTTIGAASMFDQKRIYDGIQKLVDEKYDTIYRDNYKFYASQAAP